MENKKKVSYFYDSDIGDFYYGMGHPMKPHRVRMAHELIVRYGLYRHLQVHRPVPAGLSDMAAFHSREYLEFLATADQLPQGGRDHPGGALLKKFSLISDCPAFEGLYRYCQVYTGGSMGGAVQLNHGKADVVINWAGGLHHAKKAEASGFCYVNDIVLAILELLRYKQRVLYVDIDVHHGDGVEEAFLTTDRVLTVSFHKHGDEFFPGTGDLHSMGTGRGAGYSVNVPLHDGIDDAAYEGLFKPIMAEVMARFQPEAIVLQSGADSLAGDRLGCLNLSSHGHASCHRFMGSFGVPMLVLGGGGYKIKNVARCWALETAVHLGLDREMTPELPPNSYWDAFKPDYALSVEPDDTLDNKNSMAYLEEVKAAVLENLRLVRPVSAALYASDEPALPVLHSHSVRSGPAMRLWDPEQEARLARQRRADRMGLDQDAGNSDEDAMDVN